MRPALAFVLVLLLAGCGGGGGDGDDDDGAASSPSPATTPADATATPAAGALRFRVTPRSALAATARRVGARVADLDASVRAAGDTLTVTGGDPAQVRARVLAPGRLELVDWEASVLQRGCRPTPGRAADYRVLRSVRGRAPALRAARRCGPGVRPVELEPPETSGVVADSWALVRGRPAVTGAEIVKPEQAFDAQSSEPIVTFELTPAGRRGFAAATRDIARRGTARAPQHFAIVLDDRILSLPFVDPRANPNGIDGRSGVQIAGAFTVESARTLATVIASGPLPGRVTPAP